MSKLSLKQAAEFAGTTKPTILKHMAKGKVSGEKDADGRWWFDVSELVRVYGEPGSRNSLRNAPSNMRNRSNLQQETLLETITLSAELAASKARLQALEEERERERRDKDATIADLRIRFDASEDERRRKDIQLTTLIANQPQKVEEPAPTPKGFLARLFRQ
jgi:hypothetical protein